MKIKVNYFGRIRDKIGMDSEFVTLPKIKNTAVLNVIIHIIQAYDKEDDLVFGTKDLRLGENFTVRVNGKVCTVLAELLEDGDFIDIHTR